MVLAHTLLWLQICIDPSFRGSIFSLVDRGFIYVIAHIRGGGEMGRKWYEDGKLLKKKNTFTDFIDCAEHLIQNKYCSKEKLCVNGRSAGGLLMGAVLNMRPDLFKAAVAGVPFVDVVTTMLDPTIPLTTAEWEVSILFGSDAYYAIIFPPHVPLSYCHFIISKKIICRDTFWKCSLVLFFPFPNT